MRAYRFKMDNGMTVMQRGLSVADALKRARTAGLHVPICPKGSPLHGVR